MSFVLVVIHIPHTLMFCIKKVYYVNIRAVARGVRGPVRTLCPHSESTVSLLL